jgi:hypothetical protein
LELTVLKNGLMNFNRSMKTHITLIGGQLIPVYQGIAEFKSDLVVLVHTKETSKEVIHLSDMLETEVKKLEVKPVDLHDIHSKLSRLFDNKENEISVNITSGTKIMSLVLFQLASEHPKAVPFYIDQNHQLYDFKQAKKRDLQTNIDTIDLFRVTGYPLKSFRRYEDIYDKEFSYISDIKQLIKANPSEYFRLLKQVNKRPDLIEFFTEKGSHLKYHPKEKKCDITLKQRNKSNFIHQSFLLPNLNSYLFNTGWFEIEIAKVLKNWKHTQDIIIQAKVPYETGSDKNEIDIIVNTGKKLLFVECKLQVNDIKDIDKFRNVVKNYGGLGTKSILITQQEIKRNVAEKCQDNGIIYFNYTEQTENSLMRVEDALFLLLEEELSTINPK